MEGDALHWAGVAAIPGDHLARLDLPQRSRAVVRAGEQRLGIGTERRGEQFGGVILNGDDLPARLDIPDVSLLTAQHDEPFAVAAAGEERHRFGEALEARD